MSAKHGSANVDIYLKAKKISIHKYFIIMNLKSQTPMNSFIFVHFVFIELAKLWIMLIKHKIPFKFTQNILLRLKSSLSFHL